MSKPPKGRLPLRDDVKHVTYWRKPTPAEIKFGHGAIHYRTFPALKCCHKNTRILKSWFTSKDDGLRYYR